MKTVCTLLGLSADADESSVHAAVSKILNRGDISPDALTTLRAEHKTLGEQNLMLLGEQSEALLDVCGVKDEKVRNRMKASIAPLKNREERLAYLSDFGYMPGKTTTPVKTETRILNRGNGAGHTQQVEEGTEQAAQAERERATKVTNRASAIQKETPSISLATAFMMADQEIK